MGGGNHGYLALVLIDEQYVQIPNTESFVAPSYPLPLIISSIVTLIEVLELKERHVKRKRLYVEYKNVEKALLRHIQEAIKDKYIASLVYEYTNLLNDDIPAVIRYLLYNYRKVRSKEVAEKEQEVMSIAW